MSDQRTGQCLCGAVKVRADIPNAGFQACHCVQCQRWTGGGPYYAIRALNIEWQGADNIRTYHASEWGERANCATCGSILYWSMKGKPPAFLPLGLLDDQTGLELTEEIFSDRRAPWLHAWDTASQSTEAEQQAQLQEYLDKQA